MASKSKKRRRVFRASCILAALIIAGSSFAWFTSKDEVTNRLTANSDYGVSIVESFVPPKNMIPGQKVNKDVYAVNTGSIGAFVKETLSGKLTYTYEKRVSEAPVLNDDVNKGYVRLDTQAARVIDGATTHEAGGFLAWTNAKTPVVAKSYKVDGAAYTVGSTEYDGYDGTNTVKFVNLSPAGIGTVYKIKKSDLKTNGAALYNNVGTVPQAAVTGIVATPYSDYALTSDSTYQINNVQYTIDTTPIAGYLGTENTNFYKLTRDGADESMPAELYVTSVNPATNADLYSDVGTPASNEVVGVAAAPANKTVEIETEGGDAPITPGPVGSATITDTTESTGENPIDNPGQVAERWHPTETGTYIFRRSYNPAAAAVDNTTTTYKFGNTEVKVGTANGNLVAEDNTVKMGSTSGADTNFKYKYTPDGGTTVYYAESIDGPTATFYKFVDSVDYVDTTDTLTLTVTTEGEVIPAHPEYYTYAGYYYVASGVADDLATPDVDESEGQYYKIVIGNDPFRAAKESIGADGVVDWQFDISADSRVLGNGATAGEDGIINGDPLIQYVKDVKVENVTPHLTYHNSGSDVNPDVAYLEAWYTDGASDASADYTNKQNALAAAEAAKASAYTALLEATGDAAAKEIDYENKLGEYNTALSRYEQALADYTYAKALHDATEKLITAANARGEAEVKKDEAEDAMNAALQALKDEANALETDARTTDQTIVGADTKKFGDLISLGDDTTTTGSSTVSKEIDISYDSIFKSGASTLYDIITAGAAGNSSNANIMTQAKHYMEQMETKWNAINAAADRLGTALAAFDTLDSNGAWDDAAKAKEYRDELYAAQANLAQLLKDYEELYTALSTVAASEPTLTQLSSTGGTIGSKITGWKNRVADLKTRMDDQNTTAVPAASPTGAEGIDFKTKDYIAKYNAYVKQVTETIPAADNAWMTAVNTYNKEVGNTEYTDNGVTKKGAKLAYTEAIQKNQKRYDVNNKLAKNNYEGLTKDGTALISAESTIAAKEAANWQLTDNGKTLVGVYSVERHTNGDPTVSDADDTSVSTGNSLANLWKVISKGDQTNGEPLSSANGSGYVGSMTKTTESVYTKSANANAYTPGTYADIAADTAFKTLVANGSAYKTVDELKQALGTEASGLLKELNDKEKDYKDAVKALSDANTNYTNASDTVTAANAAATSAAKSDDSSISIFIYLDDTETDGKPLNWTPGIADGETADEVPFYYNYILEPGETSNKLVDAVALSNKMTSKDYKSLVFDLNVALDSAQITYANDQRTITSEAVTQEGFGNTATVGATEADGRVAVEWGNASATPATPKIYRVGLTTVDAPTSITEIVSTNVAGKKFTYKLTYDGHVYLGGSNADGTTFYQANNDTTPTDALSPVNTIVLSVK